MSANITLRQLRAFVEVVRSPGFTAAARKLHLTQSATSLLVRELEAQLGLQLVDRTTRQVLATEAGLEFLERAERILADVEFAVDNAQDLLHKRRGRVSIATTPLLAASFMPNVIAEFQKAHPAIEVRLADQPVEQVIRLVSNGDADIGFGVFPQKDIELKRVSMLCHGLGAMVPAEWPLAKRRSKLKWSDLADQPMIALSPASGFRNLLDPLLLGGGISVLPQFEVSYVSTAVGMVDAGLGITVVPSYVGSLMRTSRVRFMSLHEPVVKRDIEMITQHGRSLSPGVAVFAECLANYCKNFQG